MFKHIKWENFTNNSDSCLLLVNIIFLGKDGYIQYPIIVMNYLHITIYYISLIILLLVINFDVFDKIFDKEECYDIYEKIYPYSGMLVAINAFICGYHGYKWLTIGYLYGTIVCFLIIYLINYFAIETRYHREKREYSLKLFL